MKGDPKLKWSPIWWQDGLTRRQKVAAVRAAADTPPKVRPPKKGKMPSAQVYHA